MKHLDKRFWIWGIAMAISLSALPLMFYGENNVVVMLIIVSYAITCIIGLFLSLRIGTVSACFFVLGMSIGAYIVNIGLIVSLRLIKMEPYALIMGQMYLFPIYVFVSCLICVAGGFIMSRIKK